MQHMLALNDTYVLTYSLSTLPGEGYHTVWVTIEDQRWMKRQPGVKLGRCARDDPIKKKSDEQIEPYCRTFFGRKQESTMWAPRIMRDWLLDKDATLGVCTGKNLGDTVEIELDEDGPTNRNFSPDNPDPIVDEIMCMDIEVGNTLERHTVDIAFPDFVDNFFYDWFDSTVDFNSFDTCAGQDDSHRNNVDHIYRCVEIDDDWYLVDTYADFEDFWEANADQSRNGHCDDYGKDYDYTLEMSHYSGNDPADPDTVEETMCFDIEINNGDERHSVDVSYPDFANDLFYDWFRGTNEYEGTGTCSADESFRINVDPIYMCVEVDNDWYLVDTYGDFEKFFEDNANDSKNGHCDDFNKDYDYTLMMKHHDGDVPFGDNRLCVFFQDYDGVTNANEYHTVLVSDKKYDWFNNRAEDEGECDSIDEVSNDFNDDLINLCVSIGNKDYNTVTTMAFKDWWEDELSVVRDGTCSSNNINSSGDIFMIHDEF
jgi:hypothetical protein